MRRDYGVAAALVEGLPTFLIGIFEILTHLGGLYVALTVLCLLYLRAITIGFRTSRRPICPDQTIFLIAAVFGGLSLIIVLKSMIALPRPDLTSIATGGYGFPSGHTMAATLVWGGFALWMDYGSRRGRLFIAGVIIATVAISRLALGLHYSVDVVASIFIGAFYLFIIASITNKRPGWAFAIAFSISIVAIVVTNGSIDSVLAVVGTAGAYIGWRSVELYGPGVVQRFQIHRSLP